MDDYDAANDAYINSDDPDVLPDMIKSYMYDLAYKPIDLQNSGAALDRVNWQEAARALIETFN